MRCISVARSLCFIIFWASFLITFLSPETLLLLVVVVVVVLVVVVVVVVVMICRTENYALGMLETRLVLGTSQLKINLLEGFVSFT